MESQTILNGYQNIEKILQDEQVKSCFIVHGHSFERQEAFAYLRDTAQQQGIQLVQFSGYTSNPKVEEVQAGVELFEKENCDFIIAVGGGSAIDVAKCIKQRINAHSQDTSTDHTGNEKIATDYGERKAYVKMLAIPTTAGTGSESTQFAVVYENGEKKSVDDADILPEYVILDADLLKGLPAYQRKATMLDALCQAIESVWAKKATAESQQLAAVAIKLILSCYKEYLADTISGNEKMLRAANLAGQAINITRTTAAHAMSYKITSLFSVAHGHAVAICLAKLWQYMLNRKDTEEAGLCAEELSCLDRAMLTITQSMNCQNANEALRLFDKILAEMELPDLFAGKDIPYRQLIESANIQRLSNNPIKLNKHDLEILYKDIFNQ